MIRIYQGSGPTEAYLVRDWLARNGIDATVRGQNLLGALGQVPVAEAWPSVYVRADEEQRARAALAIYLGPALVHPEWQCAGCGETNGPAFGSCWACDAEPG